MKGLKTVLAVWGIACLLIAAVDLLLLLYDVATPRVTLNLGTTGPGEWLGMGLLSLGMAQVLRLLER